MTEIIVYGASDDLIEVEGAIREEFDCDGEGTVLVVGPWAEIVLVKVRLEEWWSATVHKVAGRCEGVTVEQIDRPGHEPDGDQGVKVTFPDGPAEPRAYLVNA